ncbi:MAG: hypothetical protein AAGA48_08595 [Myxococcota bacterium]
MIWTLASLAFAAPLCPADAPKPTLHVVLWERRLPDKPGPFGRHLAKMREAFISHCNSSMVQGDLVSVFPEGLTQGRAEALHRRFERLGEGDYGAVYQLLERVGALARIGDADPLDPVHLVLDETSCETLNAEVYETINRPMLRGSQQLGDEASAWANPRAQRAVSHPELMVHHAFVQAQTHWRNEGILDKACHLPYDLTLSIVGPGGRSYEVNRADSRILDDYGSRALAYFHHLHQALYNTGIERELDGYRTSSRVALLDEAGLDHDPRNGAAWRSEDGSWNPLFWTDPKGEPLEVDFTGKLPVSLWFKHLPPATLTVPDGVSLWEVDATITRNGVPVVNVPVEQVDRQLVLNLDSARSDLLDSYTWSDPLVGALVSHVTVVRTAGGEDLPPFLVADPLEVLPAPPVRVGVYFYTTTELIIIGGLLAALATLGLLVRAIFYQPRRLAAELRWRTQDAPWLVEDDLIDLEKLQDATEFARESTIALRDPFSSRWVPGRRGQFTIRVARRSFVQAQLPLRDHEGFQNLTGAHWTATGANGLRTQVEGVPSSRLDRQLALQVVTRHDRIDHAQIADLEGVLEGREHLSVVLEVDVQVEDALGHFEPVHTVLYKALRLRSVRGQPQPIATVQVDDEGRYVALPIDRPEEGPFGAIILQNPVRRSCVTLPVHWTIQNAQAVMASEDGTVECHDVPVRMLIHRELVAAHSFVQDCAETSEVIQLALLHPPDVLAEASPKQWTVKVSVPVSWHVVGQPHAAHHQTLTAQYRLWDPELARAVCIDFGASATRILLQDPDPHEYGYLPMAHGIEGIEPMDFPAEAFLHEDDQVTLPPHARHVAEPGRLVESIKHAILGNTASNDLHQALERVVKALLESRLARRLQTDPEVLTPTGGRRTLEPGPRHLVVATVPNEAPPAYRQSLVNGIQASEVLADREVQILAEAEAVALWRAGQILGETNAEQAPFHLLVLDVGASSSDAAVVRVVPHLYEPPEIQVIATGGIARGGRDIDLAFLWAAGDLSRPRHPNLTLERLATDGERLRMRAAMEHYKKLAAAGELDKPIELTIAGAERELFLNRRVHDLAHHMQVRNRTWELATVPLLAAAGRLPAPVALTEVILTGRASRTYCLAANVQSALKHMTPESVTVRLAEAPMLKAAVSLGARQHAIGLGNFTTSNQVFRDRLIYVWRDARRRVHATELSPAWRSVPPDGLDIEVELAESREARIFRTWVGLPASMDATGPTIQRPRMDVRDLERLLNGEGGPPWAVEGIHPVPFEMGSLRWRRNVGQRRTARVRIHMDANQRVDIGAV